MEIYVSAFPMPTASAGVKRRRTGAEMAPGRRVVLPVCGRKDDAGEGEDGASFEADSPVALFQPTDGNRFPRRTSSLRCERRRARFLIATRVDEANAAPLSVF